MPFIVVLLVTLTPLIIAPTLSFYFDVVPKAVIVLCGASVLLVVGALTPTTAKGFAESRYGRPFTIGLLASVVTALVATAMAVDRLGAWNGSNWRRFGTLEQLGVILAAWLISAACAQSKSLRTYVLRSMCIAGVIGGAYGILQYFGLDPLLPSSSYQVGEGIFRIVRPPGTLGHSDYFGAWLLWPFFMGIALYITEERNGWKCVGVAATATAAISLLLSGSRGAALGLVTGVIIYSALARIRFRTVAMFVAIALVASTLLYVSPAGKGLRARAHWISDDPTGGARPLLWRDSLRMSWDHPWIGFGPDRFSAEFPKYLSTELARAYPDFYHESPHNSLLDAMTGSGIFAVLSLLLVYGTAIHAGVDRLRSDRTLSSILLSALSGAFIAQQFAVFTVPTALYFYLGAGLLAGLDSIPVGALSPSSKYRYGYGVISVAAAALFAVCGIRLLLADHSLAHARRSLDNGDAQTAVIALQRAGSLRSSGVTADLYFSRRWALASVQARDPLAKAQFSQFARNAAVISTAAPEQRQNAWYNRALLAAGNNDLAGAESGLRSAILCAPKWFKPHWSLARVLFASGRTDEARVEAALALNLNGGKDSEVASTLSSIVRSKSAAK